MVDKIQNADYHSLVMILILTMTVSTCKIEFGNKFFKFMKYWKASKILRNCHSICPLTMSRHFGIFFSAEIDLIYKNKAQQKILRLIFHVG